MNLYKITKPLLRSNYTKLFKNCPFSPYHDKSSQLKTPELVYVPQILRWIKTKIGFRVLKRTWDPDFSEGAFIYGSSQAICKITQIISKNDEMDELKKLVTPGLRRRLLLEMSVHLSDLQRKIIALKPSDIKLLIPLEVRLKTIQERKICLIALRALAIKWQEIQNANRLAIIALQTEFIRDYTDQNMSDWTLNLFEILECGIAGEAQNVN